MSLFHVDSCLCTVLGFYDDSTCHGSCIVTMFACFGKSLLGEL